MGSIPLLFVEYDVLPSHSGRYVMCKYLFVISASLAFMLLHSNLATAYEKEIEQVSSILSESISKGGKTKIAVVDFTDLQGNVTELGRFLAEEFSAALAGAGRGFEVIDRTHLKVILKEQKLSVTDIIDPETARKLGKIAGVDALITGSITPFGESIRISVKILDTATAEVIGASRGNIAKTKGIEELLASGIEAASPSEQNTSSNQQAKARVKKDMPFFQNDFFNITVKSLKKSGNIVRLNLLYENITDKKQWIAFDGYPYLIDETGERWDSKESDGMHCCGSIEWLPKLPKLVRLTFSTKGNPGGTTFSAVVGHRNPGSHDSRRLIKGDEFRFQAAIRNIKSE